MVGVSPNLTSARLSLAPLGPADAASLHRLWIEEPVRRYLWDGEVVSIEKTEEMVETNRRLFRDSRFGIWGVRERNSDQLIGFAGYWHFRDPPCLELLFGVEPNHWNRGIATESSRSVIRYGFEALNFQKIDASTDVGNTASITVLKKLGMTQQHRAVTDGLDTIFYTLHQAEWTNHCRDDSQTKIPN